MQITFLKRISAWLLAVCCMFASGITVYAYDVPNNDQKGSISVSMTYDGATVSGGTLTLYRVGEILEYDGTYRFALTGKFVNSGASLEDISSSELAEHFAAYASESGTASIASAVVGSDGTVVFSGLEIGLYLVFQKEAADGYEAATPFLVSVPMNENGTYIYDVDASPKVELKKASVPSEPVEPSDPSLPQTGQLNWPIPLMAVLGLCLFLLGWALRFVKKESADAT